MTAFQPETLSIALTSATALCAVGTVQTGSRRYRLGLYAGLVVAPMVHLWEAIVLLPVVAVVLGSGDVRTAGRAVAISLISVVTLYLITHLQPTGGSQLTSYATFADGQWRLLLDYRWWFKDLPGRTLAAIISQPRQTVWGLSLVGTLVVALTFGALSLRRRSDTQTVLLGAWGLAAASIPMLLTRGYLYHSYYLWATVPVLALTVGWGVNRLVGQSLPGIGTTVTPDMALALAAAAFVVSAGILAASGPVGTPDSGRTPDGETIGRQLHQLGATDAAQLTFVGPHRTEHIDRRSIAIQSLIYARILVRSRGDIRGDGGVTIVQSESEFSGCSDGFVIYHAGEPRVERCAPTAGT